MLFQMMKFATISGGPDGFKLKLIQSNECQKITDLKIFEEQYPTFNNVVITEPYLSSIGINDSSL